MKKENFLLLLAFLFLLVGMYQMSFVSATTINDISVYDEQTRTLTVKDSVLGNVKSTARLNTPLNNVVGVGYVKVAEFTITNYDEKDYLNVLKGMEFYDITPEGLKTKNKAFDYYYKTTTVHYNNVFNSTLTQHANGTWYEVVEVVNTTPVYLESWEKLTPADIKKNQILTVGIFTTTTQGERVEWIPTFSLGKDYRVVEWATWTADLNTNLVSYWNFNETSGSTLIDIYNHTNNGTNLNTPTQGAEGIYQLSYNYSAGSSESTRVLDSDSLDFSTGAFSVNFWMRGTDNGNGLIGKQKSSATYDGWHLITSGANKVSVYIANGGSALFTGTKNVTDGYWHMITLTRDGSGDVDLYVDGVNDGNGTSSADLTNIYNLTMAEVSIWSYTSMNLDEVAIWKGRQLTQSEVTILYDSGTGTFCPGFGCNSDNAPVVTALFPVNDTNFTVSYATFNATVTDDINLTNVSLKIDGVIAQTNTSGINNSVYEFTELGLSNGYHNWSIIAYDNASQLGESEVRTFNVSVTAPAVTLQSPVDNYNTTSSTNTFIGFVTSPDPVANVTLVQNGTQITSTLNSSGTNNTNYSFSGTFPDGSHTWNIIACDTDNDCGQGTQRTINVDSTNPSISIVLPATKQDFIVNGESEELNYTLVETNPDTCWYEYAGTNNTITCGTNTTFTFNSLYNTINLWANDTFGNVGFATRNFYYNYTLEYAVNDTSTTEGVISNFTLVLLSNQSLTQAILNYSGTGYTGSINVSGTNNTIFRSITVPGVSSTQNVNFYWNVTDSTGFSYTVLNGTQTVNDFSVDNCSNNTYLVYNFTMVDETNQIEINESAISTLGEVDIDIYTIDRASLLQEYNASFVDTNPFGICISTPLNGSEQLSIDVQVQYSADDYSIEFYNIQKETLTDDDFGTNITLFDLNSTLAQEFKVVYKDENFLGVADALVQVQRKYISEGVFKTVELPLTDANGETLVHLVLSDVIYTFIVIKDGTLLGTFENVLAVCDNIATGDCVINLNSYGSSTAPQAFADVGGYLFTFSYDNTTETVSSTFVVSSGTPSTNVLNVTLFTGSGSQQVCTDTLVSSSGTMSCAIPSTYSNKTIVATITQDGVIVGRTVIQTNSNPGAIFGNNQIFIALFAVLLLIGLGITESPIIMGTMLILGSLFLIGANLISGTSVILAGSSVMWFIIAVIIIMIKVGGRR